MQFPMSHCLQSDSKIVNIEQILAETHHSLKICSSDIRIRNLIENASLSGSKII